MIAAKWDQIKDYFEIALDLPPEERESFVERLIHEDPEIGDEVRKLLHSYHQAGDFLARPCTFTAEFLEGLEAEQYRFSSGDVLCGRFHIVQPIGQGGMGEVYKAWDEELQDHIALKILRPEISTHEFFTSRFRREVQLAHKVTHSNVCRVFDSFKHPIGEAAYIPVVSMELLQGQTLGEYMRDKGRLSISEALPVARQIIHGLDVIHAAGIVHRDLKPSNLVMVQSAVRDNGNSLDFQLKITDFGIAGRIPDGVSVTAQTEPSKIFGTPDYMAPEQFGQGRASIQSDIYSLGLILYQMVTGLKPFEGISVWERATADPPSPRNVISNLPEIWDKIIRCCLEPNPNHRFRNALAVLESLEGTASSVVIPHKPLRTRLKRAAKSKAGAITIFFLVMMALSVGVFRYIRLKNENPMPEGATVLLTNIVNHSQDRDLDGVTHILHGQLSQSTYLNLLDETIIQDTLRRMARPRTMEFDPATAREIAMRTGVPLVVFGTVTKSTDKYQLNLEVEEVGADPERPKRAWQFTESTSNKKELMAVLDHGSIWARRIAGETAKDLELHNRKPEDVTTDSWEALQFYSEGQEMAAQDRLEDAVSFFKQARDKDPNFAMAWMRAGDILDTLGNLTEGLKCWQKALAVSGIRRLSLREELRIKGMYASDTGDLKSAADFFAQYSLAFPKDYLGPLNRSYAAMMLGNIREAIQLLQKAEELNPTSYYVADHLAQYNLILNNFTEVDRYIARLRQLGHPGYADQIEAKASFLRGQHQHARELLHGLRFSEDAYLKSVSYYLEGALLAEQGQYSQSIAVLNRGIEIDLAAGDSPDCADKWLALAYLYHKSNMRKASREAALNSLECESGPRRKADVGTLLARSGFITEARQVLEGLPKEDSLLIFQVARLRLQGEILLATGHPEEALSILKKARNLEQEKAFLHDFWAHSLLVLGRTDEALRELQALQQYPGKVWHQPEFYPPGYASDLTFEYVKLAIRFDKPAAISKLKEYVDLRKAADPGLRDAEIARAMLVHSSQFAAGSISH